MNGWDGGNPEINLLSFHPQHDPPVLGEASFGDVQLGHDFDSRDDCSLEAFGRRLHVVEHSINPIANPEVVFEGLQVNVGGPSLDSPGDNQVDQADDRPFRGHIPQLIDILFVSSLVFRDAVNILDDFLHGRSADSVRTLDGFQDF